MLGYRYEGPFVRVLLGLDGTTDLDINEKNADWHLFQFGKDLSLTKLLYEQKLNFRNNISILPETLRVKTDYEESISEMRVFVFVLGSFIRYVQSKEKPLVVNLENIKTLINNLDQHIRESADESVKKRYESKKQDRLKDHKIASSGMKQFVRNLIPSGITVDNEHVSVRSKDVEFLEFLRKECEERGFKFSVTSLNGENNVRTKLRT